MAYTVNLEPGEEVQADIELNLSKSPTILFRSKQPGHLSSAHQIYCQN